MQASNFGFLENSIHKGAFSFTLPASATTSAGVYQNDGTLVKTLWNAVLMSGGTHVRYWNGTDDYGNALSVTPDTTYTLNVVTNNVQYDWQGTVGNTSDNITGETKHRGYYHCMKWVDFNSSYGYFCTGYSEGSPSIGKFNISTPNTKINMYTSLTNTGDVNFCCVDDNIAYWSNYYSPNSNVNWVWGTTVSADTDFLFASGTSFTPTNGRNYPKAISVNNSVANSVITGMAVQRSGQYLFIARGLINQIRVHDKTTGALVQTLTANTAEYLCMDRSDNLWIVLSGTPYKYTVNGDGTITGPTLSLTGLTDAMGLGISWDGSVIAAADGGTINNVKFFNNTTGILINTLGMSGGYYTDATVTNDKFYFTDGLATTTGKSGKQPFIAYQPDNTFWISDPGNYRVQRFNSGGTWLNRVMSLGATYATWVDRNNINRIYSEYLEFNVDYSVQTLSGTSGWTLTKNWGANFTSLWDSSYKIRLQTTFPNGRTFGLGRIGNNHNLIEYTSGGTSRLSAATFTGLGRLICKDGSMQTFDLVGNTGTLTLYPITGYTSAGTPSWSATGVTLAVMNRNTTTGSPITNPTNQVLTSTNKIVWFQTATYADGVSALTTGYHVGIQNSGTTSLSIQTEKSTHRNYSGDYPRPGWFDVGNKVNNNAGGNMNVVKRHIVTSYHGEFWKDSQTNYFNHYLDNGLAIGQFGTDRNIVGMGNHAWPKMAGNALTPCMVEDSDGNFYMYHGDESDHSSVHRWKISNVSSITENIIAVPFPKIFQDQPIGYLDLLTGLTFNTVLPTGTTTGWTRFPDVDDYTNSSSQYWMVKTSLFNYDPLTPPDLYMKFAQTAATGSDFYVKRDLGVNNVANSWKLNGTVDYLGWVNVTTNKNFAYIDVLDDVDKIIATMYTLVTFTTYPAANIRFYVNSGPLFTIPTANATLSSGELSIFIDPRSFEISVVNSAVTFTYGSYTTATTVSDVTCNWRKPTTLRIRFKSLTGPNSNIQVALNRLKFYTDYI